MIPTEQLETLIGAGAKDDNARVLDIITHSSMYVVAQEKRSVSQGTRETAVLNRIPESAKNP